MASLQAKRFEAPDEVRPFIDSKGKVELVELSESMVGHGTVEPGRRWSEHVKALSGTDSCYVECIAASPEGERTLAWTAARSARSAPGDVFQMSPATVPGSWAMSRASCWTSVA